ncbi:MAG TPA: RHS repeat-associated core domain-containing protein, partial [Ohtaekwangia sp.]|uniref:RHS repeat-associated core domain-containing protein n=1 Tax=Ohtaekwangia sp. TaxID=2066019 RepID=UPI002F95E95B
NAEYLYDDRGFRLAKINYQTKRTTWYIRDASGNILSIYEQAGTLPDPLQPINWTTLTNVVNTNGTLTLQSGATTGSAKASNTLAAGQDGYFEYVLDDIQPVDIGFTVSGIGTCYFSVYPKPNANVVIRKAGALQASFTYSLGHKLKLEKTGDKLRFWQNGTLRLEITGVASSTAQLFANLTATGAILDNLTFKATSTTTDQASLVQTEVPIYGAGKLGTFYPAQDSSAVYELTDHLGNVRALVRENINTYTATMEDNGQSDLTNPRVTEMNYFRNIFETEVQDVQMNHTEKLAGVPQPDKAAYLYWISGTQGMDMQDKSVGPAIALKVNTGDKINLETFARYEHKEDFTENVTLAAFSQLLGSTFAYVQGFEAMSANQATQTFQAALPALMGAGKDASQPSAFLNYIVFSKNMQSIASDRIQVSEAAAFEPDERAVKNMFEKLALNVTITEPGYIYAWVSNGSENTKVWFDDFRVSHVANFVTQATDYGAWGDVLREQKTDESIYRYSYQGQFAERDLETGWNHFELREYDPIIGRWITTDPIHQFYSPYIGMGNDPVSGNDPNGGEVNWVPGVDKEGNAIMTKQDGDTYESLVKNYGEDLAKLYDKNAINNLKVGESFQLNKGLTGQIFKDWSQTNIVDFFMNNYNCFELATKYTKGQKPGVSMEEGTFERELDQNFRQTSEMINRKTIVAMKDDREYIHAALFYGKSKDGTWYFLSKNGKGDPGFYTLRLLGKIYNPVKQEFWIRK